MLGLPGISRKKRLVGICVISCGFFIAELVVGFQTRSLALIADAIHYLNDLLSYIIALTAVIISEKENSPQGLSFGWQRAQLLGAFFNGVFLLALGLGIVIQAVERFIDVKPVENPFLVMIMGCIGLGLNVLMITILHDHGHDHGHSHGHSHGDGHNHTSEEAQVSSHDPRPQATTPDGLACMSNNPVDISMEQISPHTDHRHTVTQARKPGRDFGILAVLIHVIADAINNVGVIIAAVIIWKTTSPERFYADPAVSLFIALMIIGSATPLVKNTGKILLQSAPSGLIMEDLKHDIEKIPGIQSVHELHVWSLDQKKSIASVHVVVSDKSVTEFMEKARTIGECLHAYGIHSVTLQPELDPQVVASGRDTVAATVDLGGQGAVDGAAGSQSSRRRRNPQPAGCQILCGSSLCENLMCCKLP